MMMWPLTSTFKHAIYINVLAVLENVLLNVTGITAERQREIPIKGNYCVHVYHTITDCNRATVKLNVNYAIPFSVGTVVTLCCWATGEMPCLVC